MADYRNRLYANFHEVLEDWLRDSGGEVDDLPLSLYNRAQDVLWQYRGWDALRKKAALTISSRVATLPSDFGGRVFRVFEDTDSDGKPDKYYYLRGTVDNGYEFTDSFTIAAGHSYTITFYKAPANTVYFEYQMILTDFTGSGDEYTFFPVDLLTAQAQKIHIEEADLVGDEYKAILMKYEALLRDYCQTHQFQNVELRMRQLDDSGIEIENEHYDLDGGVDGDYAKDYDNSYDLG